MEEQAVNQRNAGERQQPRFPLRRSKRLQPRAPSSDTIPVSAIQTPTRSFAHLQPAENQTAHVLPLSQPDTEPLIPLSDAAFSPAFPPRLRRSSEKPAEVSLEEVPLLTSRDQYISELWRIQRLSPEEEQRVVAQARKGDQKAKNALIESCLLYVMHMAKVYHVYVEHDDLLDIVGVGNLAITEKVDQALEKATGSVTSYLCGVAKRSIMNYCLYRSRLIPIPNHTLPISEFPKVTSLDTRRLGKDDPASHSEIPEQTTPQETDQAQLTIIRQAVAQLTPKEQEVVEMRHGIDDTTSPLHVQQIADHLAIPQNTVKKRYQRAIKHLRKLFPI